MKRKILKILAIVFFAGNISSAAFSLNLDSVVAYPVPFNPNTQTLKIKDPGGGLPGAYSIKIQIFDINGDVVISRQYSSFAGILWNGRNGSGKKVKPGLYIIKVTAEEASGDYGKKIIRILVDY